MAGLAQGRWDEFSLSFSFFFFSLYSFNFDDKLVLWKEETSGRAGALSLPSGQQGQGAAGQIPAISVKRLQY